jgi:hypothetical protein
MKVSRFITLSLFSFIFVSFIHQRLSSSSGSLLWLHILHLKNMNNKLPPHLARVILGLLWEVRAISLKGTRREKQMNGLWRGENSKNTICFLEILIYVKFTFNLSSRKKENQGRKKVHSMEHYLPSTVQDMLYIIFSITF